MSRATSNDVARLAGVSRTSVSFAFNDPERISDATRQRILSAAEKLNYVPNPVAQMLKRGQTRTLGVLLPQDIPTVMQNPYYSQFLTGLGQTCEREGLTLLLCPPLRNSMLKAIPYAACDGFVVCGLEVDRGEVDELRRRGVPFVLVDSEPLDGVPAVDADDEEGGYLLAQHALTLGHRHIALVMFEGGPDVSRLGYRGPLGRRLAGMHRALQEAGIDRDDPRIIVTETPCTRRGGFEAAERLLREHPDLTCILSFSDIIAVGVLDALKSNHVQVPEDISVAGFDDQPEAEWTTPRLTTIRQPTEAKGRVSGDFLAAAISGRGNHPRQSLQCILVQRESMASIVVQRKTRGVARE